MPVTRALTLVEQRYHALPHAIHTESPRGVLSRIAANAFWTRQPAHDRALTLAALAVVLLVAIDRVDTLDITAEDEAA